MKYLLTIAACFLTLAVAAQDQSEYDQSAPFGFCTRSSRTDASRTYDVTGGGCYTYPVPENFSGNVVSLKSNGQDMKAAIQNAIKQNDIVILDGADGDFIVSSSIGITVSGKTIIGINNARICTQWYVTDEIKEALNAAGVPSMSTSGGGGTLPNGKSVSEEAEYNTRKIIIEMTGDNSENYRNAGIFSLSACHNVIIRNLTFVGPGSIDVGGTDLISSTGSTNCWVDHCTFQDGEDGNFDITQKSDFITVSWCIFKYTSRSYMHQNTNLIGSSDSEATGYLNTTFAFNWWGTGCKQRMPMGRVGKIHMLNNYFSSTTASNCINPRKNSEFLIEGNYFDNGVKHYYSQNDATAVTWTSDNYIAEASSLPNSFGTTVTMPYSYSVAPCNAVPAALKEYAGATLKYGESATDEPAGTKGSVYWPLSSDTNASVADAIAEFVTSTSVQAGSNLTLRDYGTYGTVRFSLFQAQSIQTTPGDDNAVTISFTTKSGYQFKASDIELYVCKVGTNNGTIDLSWQDAGGKSTILENQSPNRNNAENNYYSFYSESVNNLSTATDGTCSLVVNLYNVGAMKDNALQKKDIGLAQVVISGVIIDKATGISIPVAMPFRGNGAIYNLAGMKVDENYRGIVIKNGRKVLQ